MEKCRLSLDVDSPKRVISVLYDTAQKYYESADELNSAWGDTEAGEPWNIIAHELINAQAKIERKLKQKGHID